MGLFDKLQKNVMDKLDSKMNEANEFIAKKQEEINNLDMNTINKNLNDRFTEKTNQVLEKMTQVDEDGNYGLFGKKKDFCCFVCGSTDATGSKKTAHGKLCFKCLEKLEERNVEVRQAKYFSEDQIKALCSQTLSASDIASTFVVSNPPIALRPDEKCYYVGNACGAKIKTVTTGYVGARKGTSIRIMKGVSYHTGGSAGKAVREQVLETSPMGTFVMTGNRFVLLTSQYGFEVAGNKITSVEVRPDGFAIYEKSKTHIVMSDDVEKIAVIMQVLTAATEEQEKQKALEEKEAKPKRTRTKKQDIQQESVTLSGADEIRKYKQLMDEGIITEEQFEKKKLEILGL